MSIENKIFKILDEITYISEEILEKEPLKNMKLTDEKTICAIIISFVIFLLLIYVVSSFLNVYNDEKREGVYTYLLKLVVCGIVASMSVYILTEVIHINKLFTNVIKDVGKEITKEEISFESLKEVVKSVEVTLTNDNVSIDGVIKGLVSYGMITLCINLSIRYVSIICLIFIAPIAIILAANHNTVLIYKAWLKMFLIQLLTQEIIYIVLIIPLAFKSKEEYLFKIVLVGSIYMLYRINSFSEKIFSGIGNNIIGR